MISLRQTHATCAASYSRDWYPTLARLPHVYWCNCRGEPPTPTSEHFAFAATLLNSTNLPTANMSVQSAADVPLLISSSNASSERRISPSWTIAYLKTRLEPITGVPASSQQLSLRVGSQDAVPITAADEEHTHLAAFPLQPYAEITVSTSCVFFLFSKNMDCTWSSHLARLG
jgi:hypothetical protein